MLQHLLIGVRRRLNDILTRLKLRLLLLLMLKNFLVCLQRLRQLLMVLMLLMSAESLVLHGRQQMRLLQIIRIQGTHLHVEVGWKGIQVIVQAPLHYARREDAI